MGDDINMAQIGRRRGFDGKLQSLDTDFGQNRGGSLHKWRVPFRELPIMEEGPLEGGSHPQEDLQSRV